MDYTEAEKSIDELLTSAYTTNKLQNIVDFLFDSFEHYSWIGIYLVKNSDLILGPWKGISPTEHTKIPIGKGICGSAAASGHTEIISDVTKDKRYLACFLSTKSEIVVPIKKNTKVLGEIDIDSDKPNAFTQKDADFLEHIAEKISAVL